MRLTINFQGDGVVLKRNLLLLLSLFTIQVSHATTGQDFQNQSVTIPKLETRYEFNIAALFLKAGASNLNYVINNNGLPLQSPEWYEKEIQPKYKPGFELGARYNFASTCGTYAVLNWIHLYSSTTTSIAAAGDNYFLGPDFEIGPAGIPIRDAYGTAKFWYDVINLDVGQHMSLGRNVDLQFFGGLSSAYLKEKVIALYKGNTIGTYPGPFSMQQTVQSTFNGIGPHVGIEGTYNFKSGFSMLGEFDAAALIGTLYSNTSYISSAQQLLIVYGQTQNTQTIADDHVYQVVPGFNAKLAAKSNINSEIQVC